MLSSNEEYRMSSQHNSIDELISLTWVALGQEQKKAEFFVDDETYKFFHQAAVTQPSQPRPRGGVMACEASEPQGTPGSLHIDQQNQPESPLPHRRLEKLLPRPFTPRAVQQATSSSAQQYPETQPNGGPQRWAVFTHIAKESTAREAFVQSVIKAIEEKLSIPVSSYLCSDPAFHLHLPVAVQDHAVVLFFLDSHLQSGLTTLLESIPAYSREALPLETPFTPMGSVHGNPLRTLVLHPSTHEETSIKGQLWNSLKGLAKGHCCVR